VHCRQCMRPSHGKASWSAYQATCWTECPAQCCVKHLPSHARRAAAALKPSDDVADAEMCTYAVRHRPVGLCSHADMHVLPAKRAVMLARHLSGSMAYGPLQCTPETEHEADLFMTTVADPTARFYCKWLGPFSSSPVGIPGEGIHTFEFIMVGVQADQIAAVANWDED